MLARMTETTLPSPRLWTPAGFREDEWSRADNAEALAGNGRFILPMQTFLDLDPEVRKSTRERLGVELQPGDELKKIAGLLDDLSLVALVFPAFSDGRSFSRPSCCAAATDSREPSARPGKCWSISSPICCGSGLTSSR